jgi:hypothetical protein
MTMTTTIRPCRLLARTRESYTSTNDNDKIAQKHVYMERCQVENVEERRV